MIVDTGYPVAVGANQETVIEELVPVAVTFVGTPGAEVGGALAVPIRETVPQYCVK